MYINPISLQAHWASFRLTLFSCEYTEIGKLQPGILSEESLKGQKKMEACKQWFAFEMQTLDIAYEKLGNVIWKVGNFQSLTSPAHCIWTTKRQLNYQRGKEEEQVFRMHRMFTI